MSLKLAILTVALHCVQAQNYNNGPTTTPVPILKQINKQNDDGSYSFGYEAADGSFKIETKYPNGDVAGKYGYIDADGKTREVSYGAGSQRGFEPEGTGIQVPPPHLNPEKVSALADGQEDDGQYREDPSIYEDPKYNGRKNPRPSSNFKFEQAQPQRYQQPAQPAYQQPEVYQPQQPAYQRQQQAYQPQQPAYQPQQPAYQPQQQVYQPQPSQFRSSPSYSQQSNLVNPAPQTFPQSQVYHQQPQFSYQGYTAQPQPQYSQAPAQPQYNPYQPQNFNPFLGHPAQNFDPSTGSYTINFTG